MRCMPASNRASWRGLHVVNERVQFGRARRWIRRNHIRFEPDGLVLCSRHGNVLWLPWDDYRVENWQPTPGWSVQAEPGSKATPPSVQLAMVDAAGHRRSVGLAGWRALAGLPFDELPALIEFLAGVPHARAGLALSGVPEELVAGLSSKSWRRPRPRPGLLTVNGYDVHIDRMLSRHSWFVRGRLVEGTDEPDVETIIDELVRAAPPWAHLGTKRDHLRSRLISVTKAGRWPFGPLTRSHAGR